MATLGAAIVVVTLAGCGPTIGSRVDDGVITTRVRTALLYDAELATRRLTVVTVDGVVTLSGNVRSADEAARAVNVARTVAGVRDVQSQLIIRPGGTGPEPGVRSP